MTTSTAALYIPKVQDLEDSNIDLELSAKTADSLLRSAKSGKVDIKWYNFKAIGEYITKNVDSEFTQRYAVGALTKILNGQAVTNKTMLDSLFNTYAPVLNAGLYKTGYNSLMAMKDAVTHGTINPSNFLSGLSTGIESINNERISLTYKNQNYEEIPIDVVEKCEYEYKNITAKRKTQENEEEEYIKPIENVIINLTCHIKNKNAELWEMNDFSYKLADAMAAQKEIVMRIGKTIYEGVVLFSYKPIIENINDIKFEVNVSYKYKSGQESVYDKKSGCNIIKNKISQNYKNKTASTEYIGPSLVEQVTKKDTILIAAIKKFTGKESIRIDGEYV